MSEFYRTNVVRKRPFQRPRMYIYMYAVRGDIVKRVKGQQDGEEIIIIIIIRDLRCLSGWSRRENKVLGRMQVVVVVNLTCVKRISVVFPEGFLFVSPVLLARHDQLFVSKTLTAVSFARCTIVWSLGRSLRSRIRSLESTYALCVRKCRRETRREEISQAGLNESRWTGREYLRNGEENELKYRRKTFKIGYINSTTHVYACRQCIRYNMRETSSLHTIHASAMRFAATSEEGKREKRYLLL